MSAKQQKQPAEAEIDPRDLYRRVYKTREEMRGFLARCDRELEINSPVFRRRLPELMTRHEGKFVLMRGGRMLGVFSDRKAAYAEGNRRFKDCLFNAMKVEDVVYCMPSVSVDYRLFSAEEDDPTCPPGGRAFWENVF